MKSMGRSFWLLLGVCSLSLAALQANQVIESVEQHYNGARTLSVNFVEDYSVQGHPRPTETGKLMLRKQGKMRWDYTSPAGKVFVSDGKTVFLYTSADNRVEKIPLKDTEDMRAPLAFLLGHLDIRKEFRDISVTQAENEAWVDAKPKNDRMPYSEIKMLVSRNGSVNKLTIVGRDETVLNFTFSQEQMNPYINDAMFRFVVPVGAEVVNAVGYAGQGQ